MKQTGRRHAKEVVVIETMEPATSYSDWFFNFAILAVTAVMAFLIAEQFKEPGAPPPAPMPPPATATPAPAPPTPTPPVETKADEYNQLIFTVMGILTAVTGLLVLVYRAAMVVHLGILAQRSGVQAAVAAAQTAATVAPAAAGLGTRVTHRLINWMFMPQVMFFAFFTAFMVFAYFNWSSAFLQAEGMTFGQIFLMNLNLMILLGVLGVLLVGSGNVDIGRFLIGLIIVVFGFNILTALTSSRGGVYEVGSMIAIGLVTLVVFLFALKKALLNLPAMYAGFLVLGMSFTVALLLGVNMFFSSLVSVVEPAGPPPVGPPVPRP